MTFYSKIAECLRQRGITCVVVVPPLYEASRESPPGRVRGSKVPGLAEPVAGDLPVGG